jgi:hypothetical protein
VVLVGALDIASRYTPGTPASQSITAFAPGLVALDPLTLSALMRTQQAASTTPFTPTRLTVASLGIDASVERVGVKPNGTMANPSNFVNVGWYEYGAKPGEAGNTVIAGHVNNGIGLSGVFSRLGQVAIGERIVVRGKGGETQAYVVREKTQYTTGNAPLKEIFSIEGPPRLILITCEGDWDPETRSYDKRLVVVAEPL